MAVALVPQQYSFASRFVNQDFVYIGVARVGVPPNSAIHGVRAAPLLPKCARGCYDRRVGR